MTDRQNLCVRLLMRIVSNDPVSEYLIELACRRGGLTDVTQSDLKWALDYCDRKHWITMTEDQTEQRRWSITTKGQAALSQL